MRSKARCLAAAVLVSLACLGCQQEPPDEGPAARKSFADDAGYDDSAEGSDSAAETARVEREAASIEKGWEQVRETDDDAERQRQAGELLNRTRELADGETPAPQ